MAEGILISNLNVNLHLLLLLFLLVDDVLNIPPFLLVLLQGLIMAPSLLTLPRPCINEPPKPHRDQDFYENALTGPCEPIHLENHYKVTKLFAASEGFHYEELDLGSTFLAGGAIHRINPESECAWGLAQNAAVFAIGSHNKTEGTNLTLRRVERVVETVGPYGIFFFITLQASDDSFYKTKVHGECFPSSSAKASVNAQHYCGLFYEFTLNFFRRAVHHPSVQWD